LSWTAPADSGAEGRPRRYDLRRDVHAIDAASFASAIAVSGAPTPSAPGTRQSMRVTGLAEATTHHFAIESIDRGANPSPVSDDASASTPSVAPAPVHDLRVVAATDSTVTLRWTATGDDGTSGRCARYELRAAEHPLDDASFDGAPLAIDVIPHVD